MKKNFFYIIIIVLFSTNLLAENLNEAYIGQWVDPDLGNYQDDYVGRDVGLGLGYCYNGDDNDESDALQGVNGYGENPPAVGVDFFRDTVESISLWYAEQLSFVAFYFYAKHRTPGLLRLAWPTFPPSTDRRPHVA